jgi:hypothetical protein
MFIAGRPPFPHASPNAGRCEWSSGLSRATRGLHYISWHRCSTAQDRGLPRDLTRTLPFMLVFSRRVAKIPPQSCPSDLSRTSSRGFEIEAGLKLIQVTTRKSEGTNQKVQVGRHKSEGTSRKAQVGRHTHSSCTTLVFVEIQGVPRYRTHL